MFLADSEVRDDPICHHPLPTKKQNQLNKEALYLLTRKTGTIRMELRDS